MSVHDPEIHVYLRSVAAAVFLLLPVLPRASPGPPEATAPVSAPGAGLPEALAGTLQQAPPRCDSESHRAFDFWIGRWEVRRPDGELAGRNTIRRILDGCVIHERYTTPRGYAGQSFNIYDRSRDVWHQTWVDRTGQLLVLEGGLRDGAMVLAGETVQADGSRRLQGITWRRIDGDPNRVRQLWEASSDGGETWETVFDGRYHRMR